MALYEHLQSGSLRLSDSSEKLPKRTRDSKTKFLKEREEIGGKRDNAVDRRIIF
jgi:hypothetical protein